MIGRFPQGLPIHIDQLCRIRPGLLAYVESLLQQGLFVDGVLVPWRDACLVVASAATAKSMDKAVGPRSWSTPPRASDLRVSFDPRRESCAEWRRGGMVSLAEEVEEQPWATPIVYCFGPGPRFICSVMHVELEGGAS